MNHCDPAGKLCTDCLRAWLNRSPPRRPIHLGTFGAERTLCDLKIATAVEAPMCFWTTDPLIASCAECLESHKKGGKSWWCIWPLAKCPNLIGASCSHCVRCEPEPKNVSAVQR